MEMIKAIHKDINFSHFKMHLCIKSLFQ